MSCLILQKRVTQLGLLLVFVIFLFFSLMVPGIIFAAPASLSSSKMDIVYTYEVEDENVSAGDVISYQEKSNTYILTRERGSKNIFGVVPDRPTLVFQQGEGTPIVTSGKVWVNAILKKGESIEKGDLITSSSYAGLARKAEREDNYLLGKAKSSFSEENTVSTTTKEGRTILKGKVLVELNIGKREIPGWLSPGWKSEGEGAGKFIKATVTNIIQYIVAAFVAIGSVYLAFKNFTPNLEKGVISMGRNPRARGSIRSMVIFNAFLMILLGIGGLLVAVGIIMLPI